MATRSKERYVGCLRALQRSSATQLSISSFRSCPTRAGVYNIRGANNKSVRLASHLLKDITSSAALICPLSGHSRLASPLRLLADYAPACRLSDSGDVPQLADGSTATGTNTAHTDRRCQKNFIPYPRFRHPFKWVVVSSSSLPCFPRTELLHRH